ncbi:hypothetical protein KC853_02830, partial [Candidatus Saccharibacteria bacterium]|nr:hypothetical protein [Candidatus Saccharibacteria bacterium]
MSKISKKITALSYSAIALLSFVPIISTQAATTTLDITPDQNQVISGDPYDFGGTDVFDDLLTNFSGTFPIDSEILGTSTGAGGFDTAFLVPQASAGCIRYLNQATIEIGVLQNDGNYQYFGIGFSNDGGNTLDMTGTFSANLPNVTGTGFASGTIDPANGPVVASETFSTPLLITTDSQFVLAVSDSPDGVDLQYQISSVTFNVTDDCTNQVPVANPDNTQVSANQAVTLNVLANDTDSDNDSFTV